MDIRHISQYILGIQPTLDGLRIAPCIPVAMPGFTVTRTYRGAVYEIAVDNAAGVEKGVKCITADGAPCVEGILPAAPAGTTVHVKVTMG